MVDVILSRDLMSDETTVAMLGHIAARTRVCAMVIDREGRILAVNQSGLDLLEVALSDICGQVWAERWQSPERERADLALARAFAGETAGFTGLCRREEEATAWEVEILPLERRDHAVATVLMICRQIEVPLAAGLTSDDPKDAALGDALHAFANLASVAESSVRLLERVSEDPKVSEIAAAMQQAADAARDRIVRLTAQRDPL